MNEEQIKTMIRQELQILFGSDKFVFQQNMQLIDGKNLQLGKNNGTKIGTEISQKLGFFNAVPVDQPATVSDPSGVGDAGVDTPARTAINAIIDRLQELGLVA